MELLLPERRALSEDDLLELYDPGRTASLRAGFVLSVDGAAAVEGSSRGLQVPSDQAAFRVLRTVADAVLVGAGTVRTEDYGPVRLREPGRRWRQRRGRRPDVPLVVVSRRLDLAPTGRWAGAGRPVVVTCASAPAERRTALAGVADLLVHGEDEVDLAAAVADLRQRGLPSLLCEGGPGLLSALLRADLVDELCLTVSPVLVGGAPVLADPLGARTPLRLVSLVDGGDGGLLCRWTVLPR